MSENFQDQEELDELPPEEEGPPEEASEEPAEERDAEELARYRGWKPKDEWKGAVPKDFVEDPEEFNRRHEENIPKVRQERDKYRAELEEVKELTRKNFELLRSSHEAKLKEAREETERLRKDARERMRLAAEQGDRRSYVAAEADYDKAVGQQSVDEKPATPPRTQYRPQSETDPGGKRDPAFIAWHQDNAWFQVDQARTKYALSVATQEAHKNGIYVQDGRRFYDFVSAVVERDLGKFQGSAPAAGTMVPSAGGAQRNPRAGKAFASLPADAKNEFQWMVRNGIFSNDEKGRKEFADAYYSEN